MLSQSKSEGDLLTHSMQPHNHTNRLTDCRHTARYPYSHVDGMTNKVTVDAFSASQSASQPVRQSVSQKSEKEDRYINWWESLWVVRDPDRQDRAG